MIQLEFVKVDSAGGGVSARGVDCPEGGVCPGGSPGGGVSAWGVCVCPGGVYPGGCLPDTPSPKQAPPPL